VTIQYRRYHLSYNDKEYSSIGVNMSLFQWCKKSIIPAAIIWLVAIVGLGYLGIHFFHFLTTHDAEEVHFFIFIATAALVVIAYFEFNRSNKLTANEFLLFTSNRWNSKAIIKARQILHDIFIDAYRDEQGKSKCDLSIALNEVSKKTLLMSRSKGKDFIYLLNLLDYLETLSYFYHRDDLSLTDIQNTCGNNLIFFYESFKAFIEQRRSHDKKYFINFVSLYHDLKKCEIHNDRSLQEVK